MPIRVLAHGNAATMDSVGLLPGTWDDIPSQGQFLIDVEFLTRYTQSSGGMCVYCKYPSYLPEIAALFPWLHFYVYGHTTDPEVYDPSQPDMSSPVTVQVRYNMTISQHEYTKEMARVMGENRHSTRTLICHGVDPLRQLALHALLKPNFSLMDIAGVIPADYLEGEIILPVFIPINRIFASLVVFHSAKWASYDPEVFKAEMGFFQGVIRGTHDGNDQESKNLIANEYARQYHGHNALPNGCPAEILVSALLSTVDMLAEAHS